MKGYFRVITSSTWAPASTESVGFVQEQISCTDCMRTSFASFKFWAGYVRKALIATCIPLYSPRQTSVNPPDAAAVLLCFLSPTESTAEGGSCSVVLHTFPKTVTNFAVCGSMVGYTFAENMKVRLKERED